jgi:hypothetical protein
MFKAKIAAKEQAKEQALAQDQPVQDFLQVWRSLKAELTDKARLTRLEFKADQLWRALTQAEKDTAWMICFPEQRRAKDIFSAHAVKLYA